MQSNIPVPNLLDPQTPGHPVVTQKFAGKAVDYSKYGIIAHNGLDIAFKEGTPIYSVEDARVEFTGYEVNGAGNFVYTRTPTLTGFDERAYFHLKEIKVKAGDMVKRGDLLGTMGSTGNSTGPHLHYGLRKVDKNGFVLNRDNGYGGYIDPWNDVFRVMNKGFALSKDGKTAMFWMYIGDPSELKALGKITGVDVPLKTDGTPDWSKITLPPSSEI